MGLLSGIRYNINGLAMGLRTPSLLFLGLIRFGVVLGLTLLLSGLVLYWHDEILAALWQRPGDGFMVYIWQIASWLFSLVLAALAMVLSYLIAQIFFCAFIMDAMSRITERLVTGESADSPQGSKLAFFIHLIRQEIPRTIVPVFISLFLMLLGFFTPLSPVIIVVSSISAGVFLAWDNTDLIPARQMLPFRERLGLLRENLFFHIGFGLLFLIPWINILFLSFAPVGATLYYIDKYGDR